MRIRRVAAAVLGTLTVAAGICAPAAAQESGTTDRVVLIVPGQAIGALPYQPMAAHLAAEGYRTRVLDLPGFDLRGDAHAIGAAVDEERMRHPGSKIALVGHSIGGVTSRYYLSRLGGHAHVADYVAIGTPQYGSPGACGRPVGADACPGTAFLQELNAGDDTPGDTRYYSVRNALEWVDGRLDGGQCRTTPIPALPGGDGGVEHAVEPIDPRVWETVRTALSGTCDGMFVDDPDGAFTAEETLFPGPDQARTGTG